MKDGCKDSLEVLYLRFYNNLFDYAVSFCGDADTAEDQIHALFLKIWERRELLPEVEYVKTYLWTSLWRSLIDEQRRQFRLDTTTNLLKMYDFTLVFSPVGMCRSFLPGVRHWRRSEPCALPEETGNK